MQDKLVFSFVALTAAILLCAATNGTLWCTCFLGDECNWAPDKELPVVRGPQISASWRGLFACTMPCLCIIATRVLLLCRCCYQEVKQDGNCNDRDEEPQATLACPHLMRSVLPPIYNGVRRDWPGLPAGAIRRLPKWETRQCFRHCTAERSSAVKRVLLHEHEKETTTSGVTTCV